MSLRRTPVIVSVDANIANEQESRQPERRRPSRRQPLECYRQHCKTIPDIYDSRLSVRLTIIILSTEMLKTKQVTLTRNNFYSPRTYLNAKCVTNYSLYKPYLGCVYIPKAILLDA